MRAFCISHRKDVDGLGSAAMVVAATGAEVLLSDYEDMVTNLKSIPGDTSQVVICDLGVDNADFDDLLIEIKRLSARAKVTYVDHHYMSPATRKRLRAVGVHVVHDVKECSSMLVYKTFKSDLPERARLLALCGAVTDYMDDSPMAKKMMEQADRPFVLLEASMLSFALGRKAGTAGFPEFIVAELSKMKHPHEIDGVPQAAVEQLAEEAGLGEHVKSEGKKLGRLAYMVTTQYSTGNIAKLLIGAFGAPVGVALKSKEEGWYEVSLRGTSECRAHLGKTIAKIASQLGGSGGGHRKAAGCRVPISKADEMLKLLSKKI
ncbi:MAG: DHHA1 domain-containing protein [Thaumarchaeota archaeon]|nr:DHHA1 domain-containing protein [Nitrososphaerota archaeon]